MGQLIQQNVSEHNSTTIFAKLQPYSVVSHTFSLLKYCKIIYPNIEDAHGIHIITVETQKYFYKIIFNIPLITDIFVIHP